MASRQAAVGSQDFWIGCWGKSFGVGGQMEERVVNEKMIDLISDVLGLKKM